MCEGTLLKVRRLKVRLSIEMVLLLLTVQMCCILLYYFFFFCCRTLYNFDCIFRICSASVCRFWSFRRGWCIGLSSEWLYSSAPFLPACLLACPCPQLSREKQHRLCKSINRSQIDRFGLMVTVFKMHTTLTNPLDDLKVHVALCWAQQCRSNGCLVYVCEDGRVTT